MPSSSAGAKTGSAKPSPAVQAARPEPASLQLVIYPSLILKKRALEVTQFDDWLRAVVERMKDVMLENKGVGLAAPQVGLGIRLFVWSPEGNRAEARAFINPIFSGEQGEEEAEEGCLSLPDIRTKVVRFKTIHVEAVDENETPVAADLADFPARICQHEYDHIEGILLLDRMSPVAKLANRKKVKELEERGKPVKKKSL